MLIILAGISIGMLAGDNGILQKATDAKTLTERSGVVEQARTDVLGYQAENKSSEIKKLTGLTKKLEMKKTIKINLKFEIKVA